MIRFCYYCGEGYNKPNDLDNFVCPCCQGMFKVQKIKEALMTIKQAEAAFNAIPLTDKKAVRAQKRNSRK